MEPLHVLRMVPEEYASLRRAAAVVCPLAVVAVAGAWAASLPWAVTLVGALLALAAGATLVLLRGHHLAVGRRARPQVDLETWGVHWRMGLYDRDGVWFDAPVRLECGVEGDGAATTLWAIVADLRRDAPRVIVREHIGGRGAPGVAVRSMPSVTGNRYVARGLAPWIERARALTAERRVLTLTAVDAPGARVAAARDRLVVPRDGALHRALRDRPTPFEMRRDDLEGTALALLDRSDDAVDAKELRAAIAWLGATKCDVIVGDLTVDG